VAALPASLDQELPMKKSLYRAVLSAVIGIGYFGVATNGSASAETRLTTQDALLDGQRIAARSEIRVAIPDDVVKAVAQDRGALGITQIALVRHHHLPELQMETFVGQPLQLVSLGEPTDAMLAVIAATRGTKFEEDP